MNEVAVVGAGAAGLMASVFAAREGARVTIFDGTGEGGKKILISGGGRCNVLPSRFEPERFVTGSSKNSLRKILKSWPLEEQREFFQHDLRTPLKLEAESGKLFPVSNSARQVRDALLQAVRDAGVKCDFGARVTGIVPEEDAFRVSVHGAERRFRSIIIATGGLSVPATGSDGFGLAFARSLGLKVNEPYAALTPLLADPAVHRELAGISLDVTVRVPDSRPRFETSGGFLFTHRGYSGPAILDVSHFAVQSETQGVGPADIRVQWCALGPQDWDELLRNRASLRKCLASHLPARLADSLLTQAGLPIDGTTPHLSRASRKQLVSLLCDYALPWTGHEGYKKAEVTGGGLSLGEIDPNTMESRKLPRLFFCGEMLDAFGPIGGHNFLWAWATGRAAGRGAAARTIAH